MPRARGSLLLLFVALGCSSRSGEQRTDARPTGTDGSATPDAAAADAPDSAPSNAGPAAPGAAEAAWLNHVGRGAAQTERVCSRGHADPVGRALCARPAPTIGSLEQLYRVLGLDPDGRIHGRLSLAASSSGLSFRTVSALNPRVFLGTISEFAPHSLDNAVVAAFVRGEPQVELAAYDRTRDRLNFYLLTFTPRCAAARCTPEELLGPAIERGWSSWTVYEADDLTDTGLDCLSCHQPGGAGTERRLLMRDLQDPWFHWFLRAGVDSTCPDGSRPRRLMPDLRATFRRAHPAGYGGLSLESFELADGHNLHSTLLIFQQLRHPTGDLKISEPYVLDSRAAVDEWRCHERDDLWRAYRQSVLVQRGLPVPEMHFDRLDPTRAAPARADHAAYLRARAGDDSFEVAASLISDDVKIATGGWADPNLDGASLLTAMCARCHDERAPAGTRRARFRVDLLTASSAAEALRRLDRTDGDPLLMPPRRAGVLGADARERLREHLLTRTK